MADTPEITLAVELAQEAYDKRTRHFDLRAYPELVTEGIQDALAAALEARRIGRAVADDLYCQNITTLMMRRPGESPRDQADRIGQWAAEIVFASVLGAVAECPVCGSTRPGGTPSCDCAAHRDVPSTAPGEALS